MILKNIHEKLIYGIQTMLIDTNVNLPFYGEYCLNINFHEQETIGTCAVNFTTQGMNFYYSPTFLNNLSQKEVSFVIIHELFHLLFDHPKRTASGLYDHKLSNIVQDMIINHLIWEDITHDFVEIPKNEKGQNMALFVPIEYNGKLIYEELYMWMLEQKDKWEKKKENNQCKNQCESCSGSGEKNSKDKPQQDEEQNGKGKQDSQNQDENQDQKQNGGNGNQDENQEQGGGNQEQDQDGNGQDDGSEPCPDCNGTGQKEGTDTSGKPSYGPYGKNPKSNGDPMDTWSTDQIFENMENGSGEYLDKHIGDEIPAELRESIVNDVVEKLRAHGHVTADIEGTLGKLRKKRKDYLKEIKRTIANTIFGNVKQRTITRPNRKGIKGFMGNRKIKVKINVVLDTSGSMGGCFEKILSYVYQSGIEMNLIEADTEVKWVKQLKSHKQLETIKLAGYGGTELQPAIDYIREQFNEYNTVLLTDGYFDGVDLTGIKGRVLVISIGQEVTIHRGNGKKVKQIIVDESLN